MTLEEINKLRAVTGDAPLTTPGVAPTAGGSTSKSLSDKLGISDAVSTPKPSFSSRVATDIKNRGAAAQGAISGEAPESQGENSVVRGLQAAKEGAGAVLDVGGEIIKSLFSHGGDSTSPTAYKGGKVEIPKPVKDFVGNVKGGLGMANEELGTRLNDWAEKHPEAGKALVSTLKALGATGEIAGTITTADVGGLGANKVPILGSKVENVVSDTAALGNKAKDVASKIVSKSPAKEAATAFDTALSDAQESIYPKLSPTEKQSVTLKDKKGIFGSKSVPDLVNDPKTKSVIESVANLPEDIKLKPSDTIAIKESKLDQGINRLHKGTESSLADPKVRAETTFKDEDIKRYMQDNVLNKVADEFGVDSVEYTATKKAVDTATSSIASKDAYGVYTGRQKFSNIWEEKNPRTFKKAKGSFGAQLDPQTTATVEAGRDVYNALNDFNESLLPENHPLRPRMREESNLIRAKEEMRARSTGELDKNALQRKLDKNPTAKKTVNAAGSALKTGIGVGFIK